MTLQLRRKRPTTALTTTPRENQTDSPELGGRAWFRQLLRSKLVRTAALPAAIVAAATILPRPAAAQVPQWSPTRSTAPERLPAASNAKPLASKRAVADSAKTSLGGGVVLKWKRSSAAPKQQPAGEQASATQAFANQNAAPAHHSEFLQSGGNPLRSGEYSGRRDAGVRPAAYQEGLGDVFGDAPAGAPGGFTPGDAMQPNVISPQDRLPAFPGNPPTERLEMVPTPANPMSTNPTPANPMPTSPMPAQDPMDMPEAAPAPGGLSLDDFSEAEADRAMPPQDNYGLQTIPQRDGNSATCKELREQVHSRPLTLVSLNPSPKYGRGAALDFRDAEQARQELASQSNVRDWTDYKGEHLGTGRFVDLKDNMVHIEYDGIVRTIPYIDLSDADIQYVGESWNIPGRCGTGYEQYASRDFIPTQVQWTASGACHKPTYFEQPQLERYGHTAGPVLQPLISSAKFVTDLAILPYKMGIHPPNECQYPLGYIRTGNCAPYMIQPFPWSLRGAAVQAGVVTGAAALVP